jgi:hypothetical protein
MILSTALAAALVGVVPALAVEAVLPVPVLEAPKPVVPSRIVEPPKIIEVDPDMGDSAPAHRTADRALLLREFPDDLVERMWIQDWQDLERLYLVGRLVDVPSDPVGRGIELRLEGSSRIGELEDDPYRQRMLLRLTKSAAGLLYRVAARLRLIEGQAYEPLQITSLVRTWDYQLRLTDVNPNADRTREGVPPTHCLGLAFDIARSRMSYERQQRVEFLLDQMARDGELAYYKEGSTNGLMHYHVMALPSADFQLAREYERQSESADRREVALQRHRYQPDAPCVMFGSSLEPFSAICSCELPVEVSAGDAPISH